MLRDAYIQVLEAVEVAHKAPESQEARDVVLAACEVWYQSVFGSFGGLFSPDTFNTANAVARRWRRMPPERWAHFGPHGQRWVAVRRIYWLMYKLLARLCFSPESTNPHFWFWLVEEITACRTAIRIADHPQDQVSEVLAEFLTKKFEEDHPQPPEPGEVPQWLANFLEQALGPSPEVGGDA